MAMLKNKAQEEAIKNINGPLIIIACPGSGKTTTLIRRIKNIIDHNVNPKKILMVTFANSAAKDMNNRYKKMYGENPGITFSTIHSLCFNILKKENMYDKGNIISEDVNLVISNTVNVFQGALAATFENVRHFWLIHEFPEGEFGYYKEKLDFIDKFSDEIFAVTGALAEDLEKYFPNRKIYSFAPYTQIEPKEGVKTESNDQHRIVSVGRLTQRKNQLELIKAFQMLDLAGTELVFLGAWDEDYKQLCDDYIAEHDLKNISFLGYLDDPWSEITDKDLAVFPSSMETFGLVYVESVLNGIPTILSDNAGHKSAFEYMNEQGYIYPLGDLDALTRMISGVLDGF